ncbi:MAG: two-component regulator propeller domain-containing protein [Acidobacteriota bacterium]
MTTFADTAVREHRLKNARWRLHALVVGVFIMAGPARVLGAELPLDNYALTAWTTEKGLPPGDVLAMTQDLDGYLWLGTSAGLVRFDGFQFVTWGTRGEPGLPGRSVPALAGSPDGSLWVGYGAGGGVSRIRGGQIVNYAVRDGLPKGPIAALLEDRYGTIWVGGRGGLSTFRADHWEPVTSEDGYPLGAEVSSLFEDALGQIWVGSSNGIYRRTRDKFELVDGDTRYVQNFAQDGDQTVWVTDSYQIAKRLGHPLALTHGPSVRLPAAGWRLLNDRRGHLWVAALGGGLLRVRSSVSSGVIERFRYEHKISGSPRSLFQDRDNNVWVGMRGGGLLRLSEGLVNDDVVLEGLTNDGVRALSVADDGSVWVATGHNLNRFDQRARTVFSLPQTLSLYNGKRGRMWAATAHGIGEIQNGAFRPLSTAPDVRWERISSLIADSNGDLWMCSIDQGLMWWRNGALTQPDETPDISMRPCTFVYSDRRGRVWIGFSAGGVAVQDADGFRTYSEADGLASGGIGAIFEDRTDAMWMTTSSGVSRFQNGRFTTLTAANGPFEDIVPSIVDDDGGNVWVGVNAGSGVVRFSPREMDKVAVDRAHQIEYSLYDVSDGLQGDLHWLSRPAAVRAGDGRLWFATGVGLAVIDPRNLPRSRRPATPHIELASADGQTLAPVDQMVLARTSTLRIDYAALSLSAASKLRFRYSLLGLNNDWIAAGTHREVSYKNLPPGRYRFRVSATNDGLWTDAAVWEFSVAPPFFRTTWFIAFSAIGVVCLLILGWWLRLRAVKTRFALVFAERTRVSRDIHDTLLQSLGAIGLELEAIASQLDASPGSASESLRRLRRQVTHSVREAREWIWELRSTRMEPRGGLVEMLRQWIETATAGKTVRVEIAARGRARACPTDVEEQLLRIGQESVNNALRHAAPNQITVTIEYRSDAVVLRVADDGRGFVPADLASVPTGEHWGLVTMKERVARIGGRFEIQSSPGSGTIVEATVPLPDAGE